VDGFLPSFAIHHPLLKDNLRGDNILIPSSFHIGGWYPFFPPFSHPPFFILKKSFLKSFNIIKMFKNLFETESYDGYKKGCLINDSPRHCPVKYEI